MIEVRPTVLNFSEPMKTLEALVLQKKLVHDGDPVLAWMASNVVAHTGRQRQHLSAQGASRKQDRRHRGTDHGPLKGDQTGGLGGAGIRLRVDAALTRRQARFLTLPMGLFNIHRSIQELRASDRSPWGDFFFEPVSVRSASGMRVSA